MHGASSAGRACIIVGFCSELLGLTDGVCRGRGETSRFSKRSSVQVSEGVHGVHVSEGRLVAFGSKRGGKSDRGSVPRGGDDGEPNVPLSPRTPISAGGARSAQGTVPSECLLPLPTGRMLRPVNCLRPASSVGIGQEWARAKQKPSGIEDRLVSARSRCGQVAPSYFAVRGCCLACSIAVPGRRRYHLSFCLHVSNGETIAVLHSSCKNQSRFDISSVRLECGLRQLWREMKRLTDATLSTSQDEVRESVGRSDKPLKGLFFSTLLRGKSLKGSRLDTLKKDEYTIYTNHLSSASRLGSAHENAHAWYDPTSACTVSIASCSPSS